jgi:hypothetical protein
MRLSRALKRVGGLVVPHSAVVAYRARADRRRRARARRLMADAPSPQLRRFDYEDAVRTLVARGLDEDAVRIGSIPAESLGFVHDAIAAEFPAETPLQALHIGNFVGVSLAGLSAAVLGVSRDSLVVSIDPNIPHIGIDEPQSHVLALLAHFGLQRANLVACGYTLEKTPGSDALDVAGYDPAAAWEHEPAGENALLHFQRLGARFDLALVDGSHIGDYARRELRILGQMIRPGGLVFLDDVSESWSELLDLFAEATSSPGAWPFERAGYDGRVGILRRR